MPRPRSRTGLSSRVRPDAPRAQISRVTRSGQTFPVSNATDPVVHETDRAVEPTATSSAVTNQPSATLPSVTADTSPAQSRPKRILATIFHTDLPWDQVHKFLVAADSLDEHWKVEPKIVRYKNNNEKKRHRRMDEDEQPFCTTITSFASETISRGQERTKLGIFVAPAVKNSKENSYHSFVILVTQKETAGKKTIIVWDPNAWAKATDAGRNRALPILCGVLSIRQAVMVNLLWGVNGDGIDAMYWGGYGNEYEAIPFEGMEPHEENRGRCFEACRLFILRVYSHIKTHKYYKVDQRIQDSEKLFVLWKERH